MTRWIDPALATGWVTPPRSAAPTLFVVVDTEEEFEWTAPLSRESVGVSHLAKIERVHRLMNGYGVVPTYVVDYPVATQPDGYRPLSEFHRSGTAVIGAHLHPWVTPPHREVIDSYHSYGCNLPPSLEAAKLRSTCAAIASSFGVKPRVFKAGRYGFGRSTALLVEQLGFDVDTSVNPAMDFSADGGPSFDLFDPRPFLFGVRRRLLELPCTTAIIGLAARAGRAAMRVARAGERVKLPAVLARLRLLDRIMLSPEGYELDELKRLTRTLLARGLRTFTLSFHSPSVVPGHTPYVRTASDREAFIARLDGYLDFFFGAVGGRTTALDQFAGRLQAENPS